MTQAPETLAPSANANSGLLSVPPVVLAWVGLAAAVLGVMMGMAMRLQQREIQCPNGTYFPEGTVDFRCFEYPLALQGTTVAAASIAFGVLILLVAQVSCSLRRPDTSPTD